MGALPLDELHRPPGEGPPRVVDADRAAPISGTRSRRRGPRPTTTRALHRLRRGRPPSRRPRREVRRARGGRSAASELSGWSSRAVTLSWPTTTVSEPEASSGTSRAGMKRGSGMADTLRSRAATQRSLARARRSVRRTGVPTDPRVSRPRGRPPRSWVQAPRSSRCRPRGSRAPSGSRRSPSRPGPARCRGHRRSGSARTPGTPCCGRPRSWSRGPRPGRRRSSWWRSATC